MTKKITFNGIELSQSTYNNTTLTIFDFIDNLKKRLEKGFNKQDENFQLSINVNFASTKHPKHSFFTNSSATKKTTEKVSRILNNTNSNDYSHVAGSVKVNLLIEDRR